MKEALRDIVIDFVKESELASFETGATRDKPDGKFDYEGFISPLVVKRFGEFMHKHRHKDGGLRDSDNWQLGIPLTAYMKSLMRHVEDTHLHHRGFGDLAVEPLEDSLCAIIFNASGYLLETLKKKRGENDNTQKS